MHLGIGATSPTMSRRDTYTRAVVSSFTVRRFQSPAGMITLRKGSSEEGSECGLKSGYKIEKEDGLCTECYEGRIGASS